MHLTPKNKTLQESGYKVLYTITGGGASALRLAEQEGSSKWFHGAIIPYSQEMRKTISLEDRAVTHSTAIDLAVQSARKTHLCANEKWISIASTAVLTYSGERQGRKHYAYLHIYKSDGTEITHAGYKLTFVRVHRFQQEAELANVINDLVIHYSATNQVANIPNLTTISSFFVQDA